jgi:integrase
MVQTKAKPKNPAAPSRLAGSEPRSAGATVRSASRVDARCPWPRRGRRWRDEAQCSHEESHQAPLAVRIGRGITRSVAREIALVKRAATLKGEAGIGSKGPRRDPKWEAARDRFVEWLRTNRRPTTVEGYTNCLHHLTQSFASKRLSQIDPLSIERHKRALVERGHAPAANYQLSVLRSLFNRCRDLGLYDGAAPRIKLVRVAAGRLRFLDAHEEARLLDAASEPLRTIILVGIHTGLRVHSEILTLHTADVDVTRRLLTVQAAYAKNGKTRTIPLNSVVRAALEAQLGRTPGPHLFSTREGRRLREIRSIFDAACTRAGVQGVTPHTLRHTFASNLVMAGVDLRTVQELGGWSSLAMVERYAHLSPAHKAEAVERLAMGITSGTPERRLNVV